MYCNFSTQLGLKEMSILLLPSLLNDVLLLTGHCAVADEGMTDVATDWVDAVTTDCI